MAIKTPSIPILCIVGRSGSGKTTLLEKLIPELKRRGYRVGTIKHHVHRNGLGFDRPGKDSWRHAQAGAEHVVLVAPGGVASVRRVAREPDLDEVAATIHDVDIILVEGYKWAAQPKIEVVRAAHNATPICAPQELLALVSDVALTAYALPRFGLDDISSLADFIERRFLSS
ncbi:MAG: molybdopterin-guanine dinucleotide biosynthesis protein B [Anaerolineae bacterium]